MTADKVQKIFDQYNYKSVVVLCPNGRVVVHKELDSLLYTREIIEMLFREHEDNEH